MIRIAAGILVLGMFWAAPARADLRVCNETGNAVSIALGYRAEHGWQSEGWWLASPNQCAIVVQGDLNARFFYLFVADDIGGGAWDGQVFMCTRDETFTIFGVEDCLARGYERTGFFEVDTQSRSDWTLQLTDSPEGPAILEPDGTEDPTLLDVPAGSDGIVVPAPASDRPNDDAPPSNDTDSPE